MSNTVRYSPQFYKNLKPLAKKYFTLKENIKALENALIENPYLGDPYGDNIYKVRWGDESMGKGKSGSFRIMYYLIRESENGSEILLLTIFSKKEADTIKKKSAVSLKNEILKSMGIPVRKKDK